MSEPTTKTLDGSAIHTFRDWVSGSEEREDERPRLRLLHHTDIRRIGASSRSGIALDAGEWQILGRSEPLFVEPGDEAWERPLEDPRISRRQLRLRYLPEAKRFEVEPHPDGKRRLGVWLPGSGIRELRGPLLLPPGAAIAIEDRALLGLELRRHGKIAAGSRTALVGESDALWQMRAEIADAARFAHPVLVLGQTGSGKEMVAQAIHRKSDRSDRPLVVVNCATLPETLADSLLFGHVKGAFSGASADREGLFRAAQGGTLFLDELGEMPMAVQAKLLRTLEDGTLLPVGRHEPLRVDVRIIAATNREPAEAMASGRLREDLYHRLAGHVIRVPTLAERHFDIPELFVFFVAALRREHPGLDWLFQGAKDARPPLPLGFVLRLLEHAWPGNVRELRNLAERCARKNIHASTFQPPEGLPQAAEIDAADTLVPASSAPLSSPSPSAPGQLAAASRTLGLAHKTVAKLFDAAALATLIDDATQGDAEPRAERLEAAAAERLLARLERHDFEQRALAAELEMSPATLVKLMQRFRIPRALDLEEAAIHAALSATGGDLEAAARRLRVSAQGLKKRLILLRLR